jgi:hypothetical protein
MSKIPYEDFKSRFKLTTSYKSTPSLQKNQYRDILHRQNLISLEYPSVSLEERDKLFGQFCKMHHPEFSLKFLYYTERPQGLKSDLIFLLHECTSLNEYLFDQKSQKVLTLAMDEIYYLFRRLARILLYYENLGFAHGDITEGSCYVDQDKKIRILLYPDKMNNLEKAAFRLAEGKSLQFTGYLLSPEQLALLRGREEQEKEVLGAMGRLGQRQKEEQFKSDVFSLGLMCLRIISPKSFYDSYDLESLAVDMKRLYILVDTLGVFVDGHFCRMLKHCLTYDPEYRPSYRWLMDEMKNFEESLDCLKDTPMERDEDEGMSLLEDLYTGDYVANRSQSSYSPSDEIRAFQLKSNVFGNSSISELNNTTIINKNVKKVREKFAPLKMTFSKSFTGIPQFKKDCLRFLETKIYAKLPARKQMNKSIGELTYKVKILPDNKKVGFIIYPNGDIYFGYLRDLKRNDIGVYFLNNGEVYHGEFRKGTIEGTGVYIFKNGDVFEGEWFKNLLHGSVKMFSKNSGRTYSCYFNNGEMVSKNKDYQVIINDIGLMEFYMKYVNKTKIVKEMVKEYLVHEQTFDVLKRSAATPLKRKKPKPTDAFRKYAQFRDTYLDIVNNALEGKPPLAVSRIVKARKDEDRTEDLILEEGMNDPDFSPVELMLLRKKRKKEMEKLGVQEVKEYRGKIDGKNIGENLKGHLRGKYGGAGDGFGRRGEEEELKTEKKMPFVPQIDLASAFKKTKKVMMSEPNFKPQGGLKNITEEGSNATGTEEAKISEIAENPIKIQRLKNSSKSSKEVNWKFLNSIDPNSYEYEGNYKNGVYHGYGHFTFDTGARFYGNFDNGLPHGKGTFFNEGGKPIDGEWKHGVFTVDGSKEGDGEPPQESPDAILINLYKKDVNLRTI